MEFIPAKELKKNFDCYGHFYNLKLANSVLNCRSTLEIKRKSKTAESPDIVVVMMNPGSSTLLNKSYKPTVFSKKEYTAIQTKEIVPARSDNAQYQIMRLMEFNNWDFVRILNLSDLRNGSSKKFQIEFRRAKELDKTNPHCITHPERVDELNLLIQSNSNKIIVAWGSIVELNDSAKSILELDKKIIGIQGNELPNFQYASAYKKDQKIKWLTEIQKEIIMNKTDI